MLQKNVRKKSITFFLFRITSIGILTCNLFHHLSHIPAYFKGYYFESRVGDPFILFNCLCKTVLPLKRYVYKIRLETETVIPNIYVKKLLLVSKL